MKSLVLASSSPYRKALLEKLGIPFISVSPDIDETAKHDETAEQLVRRLALSKAEALADLYPNSLIIGSDQVATHEQRIITKPITFDIAFQQLKSFNGKSVDFLTSLCVYNTTTLSHQLNVECFSVTFRKLSDIEIKNYLLTEQPYDCAGSFKCEGLGIALFSKMEGKDTNSLIGLPLITLNEMLINEGINPLLEQQKKAQ